MTLSAERKSPTMKWTWPVALYWLAYIAGCIAIAVYEVNRRGAT